MSLKEFNDHQKDVRARTDSLARAVFILCSGALTVSMAMFLDRPDLVLDKCVKSILVLSWWSFSLCIISLILMLFTTITRDYLFGEKWRADPDGKRTDLTGVPGVSDILIWLSGITSLLLFITGMLALGYVATNVLGN